MEVETPQGLKTGSSVIEVHFSETGDYSLVLPEARGINTRVRGEAVAVDLPDGKVLFALLRSQGSVDAAAGWPFDGLDPPRLEGEYEVVRQAWAIKEMDKLAVLPRTWPANGFLPERSGYPMLVTFRDIEKRLGWLKRSYDGGLDRSPYIGPQMRLGQRLSFLDFRRH